uniref:Phosphatidic acid phosphatase type 2/haloperoxidase domain-containing protein n=1 Tax=viral metagenome TaxID=1070528 RepID=A0A6C0ETK1_9ZZZZ
MKNNLVYPYKIIYNNILILFYYINMGLYSGEGIKFSLVDVFGTLSMVSPFLLAFLMVMISIINSNIKGFVYLCGLVLLFGIVYLFQQTMASHPVTTNKFCSLFNLTNYTVPSFNSALYMYTLIYIILPMIVIKMINFPLIIVLLLLYIIDCVIKGTNGCTPPIGILMGSFLGLFFGLVWYLTIKSSGNTNLLYYDDLISNKIACSKPTQQKFKCQVYKNGELIQNI